MINVDNDLHEAVIETLHLGYQVSKALRGDDAITVSRLWTAVVYHLEVVTDVFRFVTAHLAQHPSQFGGVRVLPQIRVRSVNMPPFKVAIDPVGLGDSPAYPSMLPFA